MIDDSVLRARNLLVACSLYINFESVGAGMKNAASLLVKSDPARRFVVFDVKTMRPVLAQWVMYLAAEAVDM